MHVATGWYRTRANDRAFVAGIAPSGAKLMTDDSYAVGWIVTGNGLLAAWWTREGHHIGGDGDPDQDSLHQTEAEASAPPHEVN